MIKLLSADPKKELLKYKWMELGQGLLLDATLLNNIPKMQEDPNHRLGECLALWFSSKTAAPLTWKSFLQALVSSGEAVIASEISSERELYIVCHSPYELTFSFTLVAEFVVDGELAS